MKIPARLQTLVAEGLIDSVVRQLKSGKEADVYVVRCGDETRAAKVYKESHKRSFRQAVDYTENRKVRNSRQARAMAKGTAFGRQQQEAAWQSAEVDALYRLAAAGVRVPRPGNFLDGVLLMELVTDAHGDAAPRLNDLSFSAAEAERHHATLIGEVVRMLCAGVIHADLSEFNILLAADGPVIIDLPQAAPSPMRCAPSSTRAPCPAWSPPSAAATTSRSSCSAISRSTVRRWPKTRSSASHRSPSR
jgi:RIO kinase 1